ncbi:hypothetical protein OH492_26260 [Vibrio chagasii]|nr:hypothetical protein [Vibrio chagasii]
MNLTPLATKLLCARITTAGAVSLSTKSLVPLDMGEYLAENAYGFYVPILIRRASGWLRWWFHRYLPS